ncbi:MAG: hypothetical protein Q9168_001993 [Polycauliona sp. 1 TL-2023]
MTALKSLKLAAENADQQPRYRSQTAEDVKIWTEKQTALDLANYRDLPLRQLVNLYIFADFAQVKGLKDAIVDAVMAAYGNPRVARGPKPVCLWDLKEDKSDCLADPISLVNSAWEKLPAGDKLAARELEEDNAPEIGWHRNGFALTTVTMCHVRNSRDKSGVEWVDRSTIREALTLVHPSRRRKAAEYLVYLEKRIVVV